MPELAPWPRGSGLLGSSARLPLARPRPAYRDWGPSLLLGWFWPWATEVSPQNISIPGGRRFTQRSGHVIARHLLAPQHVEVGIVERLGGAVCRFRSLSNGVIGQFSADNGFLWAFPLDRMRTHPPHDDFF